MKKQLLLLITLSLLDVGFVTAQQKKCNHAKREAMEAQKVAFITKKVGLTAEEAEKFWPLYNQFTTQRHELRLQARAVRHSVSSDWSEDEYKNALQQLQKIETQQHALKQKYHKEFLKILSAEKVFNYYTAENEYKKELLKHIEQGRKR